MKTNLTKLVCGLALLGAVSSATAQSTLTIDGTGSGTLNGVGFTDDSFEDPVKLGQGLEPDLIGNLADPAIEIQ